MRLLARFVLYRLILRPFLSLIIGVKFPKASEFPEGQFLLVSNHNSHLDTVSLLCSLPVKRLADVHPAAAADYFARNKVMKVLCEFFLNTVFVRRKGEVSAMKPLDELDMHLKNGKSLILFPEGTRGLPEQIVDFKCGAAVLLQRNPEVKLVPVYMIGMGRVMPKGDKIPVPTECEIRIGRSSIDEKLRKLPVMELTRIIQKEVISLRSV